MRYSQLFFGNTLPNCRDFVPKLTVRFRQFTTILMLYVFVERNIWHNTCNTHTTQKDQPTSLSHLRSQRGNIIDVTAKMNCLAIKMHCTCSKRVEQYLKLTFLLDNCWSTNKCKYGVLTKGCATITCFLVIRCRIVEMLCHS